MGGALLKFLGRKLYRYRGSNDASHIQRSRTQSAFMAASPLSGDRLVGIADVQDANALRSAALVCAESGEVHAGEVNSHVSGRLGDIAMKLRAPEIWDGENGTRLIAHQHDAAKLQSRNLLEVVKLVANGWVMQAGGGFPDAAVFKGTGSSLSSRHLPQHPVVPFCCPRVEDDLAGVFGTQRGGDDFAAALHSVPRSDAPLVKGMRIPEQLTHPWQHRLLDSRVKGTGGGVVEVVGRVHGFGLDIVSQE